MPSGPGVGGGAVVEPLMGPLAPVRRRLFQQRLAGKPFARPEEAVRWLGAVQAQEFAEAKWSLAQRSRECTDADVEGAFDSGAILRTHVLRPTWHFVAREDIRWLLRLTRPRVHALNRYWYAKFGLDDGVLTRGHEVLSEALASGEPQTRPELASGCASTGSTWTVSGSASCYGAPHHGCLPHPHV